MVELLYALDKKHKMVHVNSVANGLACGCVCPSCGAMLVAKNNGESMLPHFAHYTGHACSGAHETEMHILCKEIIADTKCLMLPPYGNIYKGGLQKFDDVELEEYDQTTGLRPDVCGVVHKSNGEDSRLWIEIRVTHAIGADKRNLIISNNISCVEVDVSVFGNRLVTKEELRDYLICKKEGKEWTNNPVLEARSRELAEQKRQYARDIDMKAKMSMAMDDMSDYDVKQHIINQENEYMRMHPDECVVKSSSCLKCKHHTTRIALMDEVSRRHLPAWVKDALSCDLRWWNKENARSNVRYSNNIWMVAYDGFVKTLPISDRDMNGRQVSEREKNQNEKIIPFLQNTVPDIISSHGLHCNHIKYSFPSHGGKYSIACDMPNVVNRHRRKR